MFFHVEISSLYFLGTEGYDATHPPTYPFSYGGACRFSDRLAGASAVAGTLSKAYLTHSCAADGTLGGAMAVASYHSVADEVVPVNGTEQWASQTEVDALWLQKNGCVKEPHLFRT